MWQMLLLISFFCLSVPTYGQQSPKPPPPQITNFLKNDLINPEQVKFRRENALVLPCGAIGSNLKWSWKHNDTLIPEGELQFGKRQLGNDGTLTGSNLGITDSGSYQCFVKDTVTNVQTFSRKIQVAVTVVGEFTEEGKKDLPDQPVTLGSTQPFKCPAHFPSNLVVYSWTGKDIKIQLQMNERRAIKPNGDLVFLFVTEEDVNEIKGLGGIQCTMSGANTFYSSGTLTLSVPPGQTDPKNLFAPTWIEFPASIEKAIDGRNKTLHCLAVGRPAPKITWKRNGVEIVHGKDSMEIATAFQGRRLVIVKVQREFHEGTYTCEADNSRGSAPIKTTNLVVEVIPKWTSGSPPKSKETIDIYGNGTLTCDVFAIPEPTFRWYRDGQEILADTAQVTRDVNRLHFKLIELADAGIYQCVAENTHGMIVSSTYVHVLALPPSFAKRGFGPFYLFQDSEGRLKCDPDAAPQPDSYRWFKDGTEILMTSPYRLESDGTLVISKVQRSRDAGQYKCSATNFLATADATAEATVLDKTQITIKPQDRQVVEGTRVDLRCEATADPTLELGYYWKMDDDVIVYNSKFQWLASQNVLTIIDITVDDAGVYTCFAYTPEPKKSEDSASATIDIAGAPYPPTNLELSTDCLNRSTTLKWVTGASNNATITHFLIKRLSDHPNDVWRLIANVTNSNTTSVALNLTGWATLFFRVRAVNRFGPSRASLPTTSLCRTEQGVPDKWPDNFRGVPGKAEELDIVWDPMPLVEWNAPNLYYRLWYAKAPWPLSEPVRISDSTLGKFNVPDAGYYQEYQFKIQAGNDEGLGPESPLVRAFSGQVPPAGKPEDVTVGTVTARSVELSWKPVTVTRGSVDGYRIYFWGESRGISAKRRRREIPSYATFANVAGGGTQTYTVTNLRPYTNYNFALRAVNSGGEGPQSDEVFAQTEEADKLTAEIIPKSHPPLQPGDYFILTCVVNDPNAEVKWKKNGATVTRRADIKRNGDKSTFVIENVEPEDSGYYACEAVNQAGFAALSTVVKIKVRADLAFAAASGWTLKWYYIVGFLLAVIFLTSVAWYIRKRRRAAATNQGEEQGYEMDVLDHEADEWEISRTRIQLREVIGTGGFGAVWRAALSHPNEGRGKQIVAAKCFTPTSGEEGRKSLMREIDLGKRLGDSPQPNIIKFIGCVTTDIQPILIVEYLPRGDLLGYMRKSRGINDKYYCGEGEAQELTPYDLVTFSKQIATGMVFLGSRGVIHRDLAARNVLLDRNFVCKVTDFGLAYQSFKYGHGQAKKGCIPIKWTAPEILFGNPAGLSTKSDVWSYGVVLYEIFTIGGIPYPDWSEGRTMEELSKGYRMPKPPHINDSLYHLMERCWHENPYFRPPFEKIRQRLQNFIEEKMYLGLVDDSKYNGAMYSKAEDDGSAAAKKEKPVPPPRKMLLTKSASLRY